MTNAEKITEIHALMTQLEDAIDGGVVESDGYPGTIMLTRDALLDMIDMTRIKLLATVDND